MELVSLLIAGGLGLSAWAFLLRWRRGAAGRGKSFGLGEVTAAPPGARPNHTRSKLLLGAILAIIVVVLALAALVIGSGMLIRPSCTTGVVIIEGPHGDKIECVCVGGVQALCFEPGP